MVKTRSNFCRCGRTLLIFLAAVCFTPAASPMVFADQALQTETSWDALDHGEMSKVLRGSLGEIGIQPAAIEQTADEFLHNVETLDRDPLDAFVGSLAGLIDPISKLATLADQNPIAAASSIDPSAADYADLESLPKPVRMSIRTWLGRTLVRARLYDEALPVVAEVDPRESIDPASSLFYRGVCYHALLMKKEALADLRMLVDNEPDCPTRFARLAQLMIADIKPLEEDSLDEVSRLMTDVSRRLELGRSGDKVANQEQKIIDKLTKLIDKLEQQQQQQQQQQQSGGGGGGNGSQGGQAAPMEDSQIAGGSGAGNVQKKEFDQDDRWGNLPPAERKEALQKISRDLPTHYRDAIEAYFRKRATDG